MHGWTQGQLVDEVPDLTQSRLSRIEKGKAYLDADDLLAANLAAVTGVTVSWLSRPSMAGFSSVSPHFRARSKTTESAKAAGLAWATLVNEAFVGLGGRVSPLAMQLERHVGEDPRLAAQLTRRSLGFGALEPLPFLVLAVERIGVRVLGLPWTVNTVDAFCAWADPETPAIALTADSPGDRRRWNVAHELGHLVLHDHDRQGRDVEAEADVFAAELLTPLDALRQQMPNNPTLGALTMLKGVWGVSVKSLVRRARELGAASDERATSLYRQISSRGWNKVEPGYVPVEKPRALRRIAEVLYGPSVTESLATEMGWSYELASVVMQEQATVDDLPISTDHAMRESSALAKVTDLHGRHRKMPSRANGASNG